MVVITLTGGQQEGPLPASSGRKIEAAFDDTPGGARHRLKGLARRFTPGGLK